MSWHCPAPILALLLLITGCKEPPFLDHCPTSGWMVAPGDQIQVPGGTTLAAFLPPCSSCAANDQKWQRFVRGHDNSQTTLVTNDSRAQLERFLGKSIEHANVKKPSAILGSLPDVVSGKLWVEAHHTVIVHVNHGAVVSTEQYHE